MLRNRVLYCCLVVALSHVSNTQTKALDLSIIEFGSSLNPSVTLQVDGLNDLSFGVARLVSPTGEVFEPSSIVSDSVDGSILRNFDSLSDAFEFATGTWQATLPPPRLPPGTLPPSDTLEFTIERVSSEMINRKEPSLLAPVPGQVVQNGSTWPFGWDYLGVGDGDAPERTMILTIPQFDPAWGRGRSVVSTPTADGMTRLFSGGTRGVGDMSQHFERTLVNVPGTEENRFLNTMKASESDLPLDVTLAIGSYHSLQDKVTIGDTSMLGNRFVPRIDFFYSRLNDPFTVTLSGVPEPSAASLFAIAVATCAISIRSRFIDF